jgi:hypothetical protein
MKKHFLWACLALIFGFTQAQTFNFADKVTGAGTNGRVASDFFGSCVAISGDIMVVGAYVHDYDSAGANNLNSAGAAYIYYRNTSTNSWNFVKKLTGKGKNGRLASDLFGYSVAIDGDIVVVGATGQDYDSAGNNILSGAGAVYIFNRNSGGTDNWGFVKKITGKGTNGRVALDQFGTSVAIDGDIVVVSAKSQTYDSAGGNSLNNAGAAYIFNRNSGGANNWGFMKKITGTGTNGRLAGDLFGYSVAVEGDIVVVGAYHQNYDSAGADSVSGAGAVYIFNRSSGGTDNWGLMKKITATGTNGRVRNDEFGNSVAISDDIVVVGAYQQNYDSIGADSVSSAGAAYIFNRNSGGTDNWGFVKKITGKGTNGRVYSDQFGRSVSISGDRIVVSTSSQDYDSAGGNSLNNAGAAYIFNRNSGGTDNWGFLQKITGTGTNGRNVSDFFGNSVAVDGDNVVVGAHGQDYDSAGGSSVSSAGAAYLFYVSTQLTYSGGVWTPSSPSNSTGTMSAVVSDGTAALTPGWAIKNLTVDSGATATLASGTFSVNTNFTNNGTISGVGTIELNGTTVQSIYGTGTTANLTLNNSAGATIQDTLKISGVLTLTTGTLTTNSKLKLPANGAEEYGQIAGTGTGNISGNVTAEYMITGGGLAFRPICSPLSGATLNDLADDFSFNFGTPDSTYGNIWQFDESISPYWTQPSGTSASMDTGAFSIYMGDSSSWANPLPLTFNITGTYFGTGNYTVSNLSRTNSVTNQTGWHYIRNPWPSGFLWNGTGTNVTVGAGGVQGQQVWVYDQSGGGYTAYDNSTTGVIPPFHPFTLEVTANNTSLTFLNSGRNTDSLKNYFDKTGLQNLVEIVVSDKDGKTDKAKFYTDNNATSGYDIMDGNKMMNLTAPNLYFVIEEKPANKEVWNTLPQENEPVQLNFEGKQAGKYTLGFNTENLEGNTTVELIDKQSGAKHDISKGDYTFAHDLNNTADRFELRFSKKSTSTNVEEVQTANVYVGSTGNTITIGTQTEGNYTVEVYDMLGRSVQAPVSYTSNGSNTQSITVNGVQTGYYIVKITGNNVYKTDKVFLK